MKRAKRIGGALVALLLMASALCACTGSGESEKQPSDPASASESESADQTENSGTDAPAEQPEKENGIYTMASMEHVMKTFGRTAFLSDGSMMNDWSASGFEVEIDAEGGAFTVYVRTGCDTYYVAEVDGENAGRTLVEAGENSFSVELSAGIHTVRVLKDSEIDPDGLATDLVGVDFAGTFVKKPSPGTKKVEIIGDSIAAGKGALGTYSDNEVWTLADHSGTNSFAYFLAKKLGWDADVMSKGGIGLLAKMGGYSMDELYPFVSGYRDRTTKFQFSGYRPDLVIVELGANDASESENDRYGAYSVFFQTVRMCYGNDVPIVWTGKLASNEALVKRYIETSGDQNLYACLVDYGGSGSKALLSQTSGHPSAEEQKAMAEQIEKYLIEKGLL